MRLSALLAMASFPLGVAGAWPALAMPPRAPSGAHVIADSLTRVEQALARHAQQPTVPRRWPCWNGW